ncbi:MAG: hypothetical protein B7Z80_09820 [Rhodospirillales bacterium 20-64-7]|nr:MAG: hypothetical protein B7Z80_09820 [Rhodospirillales bacterium 20-64-7]
MTLWIVELLPRFAVALIILTLGVLCSRWAARGVSEVLERRTHMDVTLGPVLATVARYAVFVLALIAALNQLGIRTTSVIAVLGTVGLAIGLSLQATLANCAAGLMLLFLRPFRAGDYIQTSAIAGQVLEVGLFATKLRGADGLFVFVPNSAIWNQWVKNHSHNETRLVTLDIPLRYQEDIAPARAALTRFFEPDARIAKLPPPKIYPSAYSDSAITLTINAWAMTGAYAEVNTELPEAARSALEAAGVELTTPRRPAPETAPATG